jgi:DNA-binding Lrp family transcriptional regulator
MPMAPLDPSAERPLTPPGDQSAAALGDDLAPAELAAWRGMLRVHAALAKLLDAELTRAHDLPLSSYEVLITLRAAPGKRCRMAELADRVLLSRSGMTRLVDRLERDGLLERVLTQTGEELLAAARPTHLAGVRDRFLQHFSQGELAEMAGYWERVLPGASAGADLSQVD